MIIERKFSPTISYGLLLDSRLFNLQSALLSISSLLCTLQGGLYTNLMLTTPARRGFSHCAHREHVLIWWPPGL